MWSLTIRCKQLIEGVKNPDERFKELAWKAKGFATVIGQIDNAYNANATESEAFQISLDEVTIREDIRNELTYCEKELRACENKVSTVLKQRTPGKFGVDKILNRWREEAAAPALERFEKFITDHQSYLRSLMDIHHG